MARKNPVPEREKEICKRVREIRKTTLGLSQVAMARKLGIDSSLLAAYEYGRIPIRYGFAERYCGAFNVSQRWLATGNQPRMPHIPLPEPLRRSIDVRDVFSEAYDRVLKRYLEKRFSRLAAAFPGMSFESFPIHELSPNAFVLLLYVHARLSSLRDNLLADYIKTMSEADSDFCQERLASPTTQRKMLLKNSLKRKSSPMSLSALISRLVKSTSTFGKKGALAVALSKMLGRKVSPSRITEWLRGRKEPGGAATLCLLEWVQAEEANQPKRSTRARTRVEPKTRTKKKS